MSFDYDPETKTYSCRISIGNKEPIPFKDLRGVLNRVILGVTGNLIKKEIIPRKERELTDILFWFEEGIQ